MKPLEGLDSRLRGNDNLDRIRRNSKVSTRRFPPDSAEKIAATLVDAQVDLNPHQIDAALFAFRSPLSRGALLADEVGLGKTIEAGLVLSQKWAERKRRILVITPSNLRKQWYQELTEKFFLPCRLLESKSYNAAIKQGCFRPFEAPEIVICSYQFAKSKASDIQRIEIKVFDYDHGTKDIGVRRYIWLAEYDYVLILQKKKKALFWITAYYVDSEGGRRDLSRRYEKRA